MLSSRQEFALYLLFHVIGHLMCCLVWRARETFFPSLALQRAEWSEETLGFACGTERKGRGKYVKGMHAIKSKQ